MANEPGILIRKAATADLPAVYQMIGELEDCTFDYPSFAAIFERNLQDENCHYIVAEKDHVTVGFISLHIQQLLHHCGAVGEIQEFYVGKPHRGKGIGKRLMDEVKQYAALHQLDSLEVASNRRRTENVQVYENLGFGLSHHKFTIRLR